MTLIYFIGKVDFLFCSSVQRTRKACSAFFLSKKTPDEENKRSSWVKNRKIAMAEPMTTSKERDERSKAEKKETERERTITSIPRAMM